MTGTSAGRLWRFLPPLAVALLVLPFVHELAGVGDVVLRATPRWMALAVVAWAAGWTLRVRTLHIFLRALDIESRPADLLPVFFSFAFVRLTRPALDAMAATIGHDAAMRGQSVERVRVSLAFTRTLHIAIILFICAAVPLTWLTCRTHWDVVVFCGMTAGFCVLFSRVITLPDATVGRLLLRSLSLPDPTVHAAEDAVPPAEALDPVGVLRDHWPALMAASLAAAAMHAAAIIGLASLCRAFEADVPFWVLVVAYSTVQLSSMFDLLSPWSGLPSALLALMLRAAGLPFNIGLAVALSFRLVFFWFPALVGRLVLRGRPTFGSLARSSADLWSVRLVAIGTWLMGIVNLVAALAPSQRARLLLLRGVIPRYASDDARLAQIVLGFVLLMLAGNLWRRKRMAWNVTWVALLASAVVHLVKGLEFEFALLYAVLAAVLYHLRPRFHARSDPPSVGRGLRALVISALVVAVYGTVGFGWLDRDVKVPFDARQSLRETVTLATEFHDPEGLGSTRMRRVLVDSIYAMSVTSILYSLVLLLNPVWQRPGADAASRARVRAVAEKWGRSAMAPFTLLPDKTYFEVHDSYVAYAVKNRVAVVLGDPVGPPQQCGAVIADFRAFAEVNDWDTAYYQTMPQTLDDYRRHGYESICIGHEAVVDLHAFCITGKSGASLRGAVNRMTRLGFTCVLHAPPQTAALLAECRNISDEWLSNMHGTEKRFSLGAFEDEYVRGCPIMAVHAPDGAVIAFANIIPEFTLNETTIDMMRRRGQVENGTMDFLLVSLLKHAQEQGFATFNLGLSPLAGVGDHPFDPTTERLLHYVYEHVNQFYNFKGLHEFKEKFHPTWSPRYLMLSSLARLPAVAVALARVHSGDRFVVDALRDLWQHPPTRAAGGGRPSTTGTGHA